MEPRERRVNPTALRERPDRRRQQRSERRRGTPPRGRRQGPRREVTLDDKYLLEEGRILLTGVQGLVRAACSTSTAPTVRRGLHTGTLVSGYQGSPLGGLDQELQRRARALRRAPRAPRARTERGARRHLGLGQPAGRRGCPARATTACWACGTARRPASTARPTPCATATSWACRAPAAPWPWWATTRAASRPRIPSASESLLASLHMPVFAPADVQDVLDLGLHAFACSRASGLWCGFKIVTSVADASGTAEVGPRRG